MKLKVDSAIFLLFGCSRHGLLEKKREGNREERKEAKKKL